MNLYKVPIHFAYEFQGRKEHREGYELVYAQEEEGAKKIAKDRALSGLKKQGAEIILLDSGNPVLLRAGGKG